jgi:hypothetical protein
MQPRETRTPLSLIDYVLVVDQALTIRLYIIYNINNTGVKASLLLPGDKFKIKNFERERG